MAIRLNRKVLIHIILIGIILTVVFLITLDLKKDEYNQDQVPEVPQGYGQLINGQENWTL